MGRVLFIGDSHAAHLRASLGNQPNHQWLVAPSREPYNLSLLKATSSEVYCDHPELLKILEQYNQPAEVSLDVERVVLIGLRSEFPYLTLHGSTPSIAATEQAMRDYLMQPRTLLRALTLLRNNGFSDTIDVIANPLISSDLKSRAIVTAPGIQPAGKIIGRRINWPKEEKKHVVTLWHNAIESLLAPYEATYIRQPESTITGVFTLAKYALGTKTPGDLRHMNAEYWNQFTKNGWPR